MCMGVRVIVCLCVCFCVLWSTVNERNSEQTHQYTKQRYTIWQPSMASECNVTWAPKTMLSLCPMPTKSRCVCVRVVRVWMCVWQRKIECVGGWVDGWARTCVCVYVYVCARACVCARVRAYPHKKIAFWTCTGVLFTRSMSLFVILNHVSSMHCLVFTASFVMSSFYFSYVCFWYVVGLDLSWSLMIFNGPHLSWAHLQCFGALFMCPESLLKCHRFLLICHEGVMRDFSWGSFPLLQALNGIIGAAFGAAGQRCMAIRLKYWKVSFYYMYYRWWLQIWLLRMFTSVAVFVGYASAFLPALLEKVALCKHIDKVVRGCCV